MLNDGDISTCASHGSFIFILKMSGTLGMQIDHDENIIVYYIVYYIYHVDLDVHIHTLFMSQYISCYSKNGRVTLTLAGRVNGSEYIDVQSISDLSRSH